MAGTTGGVGGSTLGIPKKVQDFDHPQYFKSDGFFCYKKMNDA